MSFLLNMRINKKIQKNIHILFFEKTNDGLIQFFRYLFVGGSAAIVDIGSIFILTSIFNINYLISAAVAFILGITTNYLISIAWVFNSNGSIKKEITLFFIIGICGLLLNELIIWIAVSMFGVHYLSSKLISTALVLFWNFGMRKMFVFHKNNNQRM